MELSHSCLLPLPSKLVFCYFGLPSQLLDDHLMLHLLHLQKIVLVGPGPVRKNLLAWSASAFKCSQAHTSAMDFPDISRSMYLLHILPRTNLSMSFFVLHGFGHLVHYDCLLRFKNISHLSFLEDVFFFQLNLNLSIVRLSSSSSASTLAGLVCHVE